MAGNFTQVLGHVDANIEERSSLVAALRAKLGDGFDDDDEDAGDCAEEGGDAGAGEAAPVEVAASPDEPEAAPELSPLEPPAPQVQVLTAPDPTPAPSSGSFHDAMAQLDKGLDARQKLINALKAQLSKSAALPKAAPACLFDAPAPAAAAGALGVAPAPGTAAGASCAAPCAGLGTGPALAPLLELEVAPAAAPSSPPASPAAGEPSVPATAAGAPGGSALQQVPPAAAATEFPAAKKLRMAGDDGALVGGAEANSDALAARKAMMLRSLGGAAGTAAPAPALDPAVATAAALGSACLGVPPAPLGLPGPLGFPGAPGGPAPPGGAPGGAAMPQMPQMPACPPGASPEQFEAYRQQCWKQYYEYCAIWQKYYDKNKQESSSKQSFSKAGGKGVGKGPRTILPPGAGLPGGGALGLPGLSGLAGRPPPWAGPPGAAPGRPADDDIHSKLLGL